MYSYTMMCAALLLLPGRSLGAIKGQYPVCPAGHCLAEKRFDPDAMNMVGGVGTTMECRPYDDGNYDPKQESVVGAQGVIDMSECQRALKAKIAEGFTQQACPACGDPCMKPCAAGSVCTTVMTYVQTDGSCGTAEPTDCPKVSGDDGARGDLWGAGGEITQNIESPPSCHTAGSGGSGSGSGSGFSIGFIVGAIKAFCTADCAKQIAACGGDGLPGCRADIVAHDESNHDDEEVTVAKGYQAEFVRLYQCMEKSRCAPFDDDDEVATQVISQFVADLLVEFADMTEAAAAALVQGLQEQDFGFEDDDFDFTGIFEVEEVAAAIKGAGVTADQIKEMNNAAKAADFEELIETAKSDRGGDDDDSAATAAVGLAAVIGLAVALF